MHRRRCKVSKYLASIFERFVGLMSDVFFFLVRNLAALSVILIFGERETANFQVSVGYIHRLMPQSGGELGDLGWVGRKALSFAAVS